MIGILDIDIKDHTAYDPEACTSYFFRSEFEDGCILAWYSNSPMGMCSDQEQGWVVIDPKNKVVVAECETRSMGLATGEYRSWVKDIREEHGKTEKVFRYGNGDLYWKKTEA